jgi:hypothetical protein
VLYFTLIYEFDDGDDDNDKAAVLEYDLVSNCLSLIDAPPVKTSLAGDVVLLAMEDGLTLNLWSRRMGSKGAASWPRHRVINLETLIPVRNPKEKLRPIIGSVEGSDVIFVTMDLGGIYEIHLKSLQWKKICTRQKCCALFPYTSNRARACTSNAMPQLNAYITT